MADMRETTTSETAAPVVCACRAGHSERSANTHDDRCPLRQQALAFYALLNRFEDAACAWDRNASDLTAHQARVDARQAIAAYVFAALAQTAAANATLATLFTESRP